MTEEEEEHDPLAYLNDKEYLSLNQLVGRAYDYFWNQNELTIDYKGDVVRSDTPRRKPKTWFNDLDQKPIRIKK